MNAARPEERPAGAGAPASGGRRRRPGLSERRQPPTPRGGGDVGVRRGAQARQGARPRRSGRPVPDCGARAARRGRRGIGYWVWSHQQRGRRAAGAARTGHDPGAHGGLPLVLGTRPGHRLRDDDAGLRQSRPAWPSCCRRGRRSPPATWSGSSRARRGWRRCSPTIARGSAFTSSCATACAPRGTAAELRQAEAAPGREGEAGRDGAWPPSPSSRSWRPSRARWSRRWPRSGRRSCRARPSRA